MYSIFACRLAEREVEVPECCLFACSLSCRPWRYYVFVAMCLDYKIRFSYCVRNTQIRFDVHAAVHIALDAEHFIV